MAGARVSVKRTKLRASMMPASGAGSGVGLERFGLRTGSVKVAPPNTVAVPASQPSSRMTKRGITASRRKRPPLTPVVGVKGQLSLSDGPKERTLLRTSRGRKEFNREREIAAAKAELEACKECRAVNEKGLRQLESNAETARANGITSAMLLGVSDRRKSVATTARRRRGKAVGRRRRRGGG